MNDFWQINNVLTKAKQQCKTTKRWNQFIHEWFDAFKLLKSVHFLMRSFNDMNLSMLLESVHYNQIVQYQDDSVYN